MPQLEKFMCCAQLRTGAAIIGWMGLNSCVIFLTIFSIILDDFNQLKMKLSVEHDSISDMIVSETIGQLSGTVIGIIISTIANIMLLWGSHVRNRFLLLPWLVLTMLGIVGNTIFVLITSVLMSRFDMKITAGVFIGGLLIIGIMLYMWSSIHSFYHEIRKDSSNDDDRSRDEEPA